MEFFRDPHFDFMRYRRYWVVVSLLALAVAVVGVFVQGRLNIGIDFAGGTQLTMRFRDKPGVDELRGLLEEAGIGDAQIQRFGEEEQNEVIIKTPTIEGSDEGSRRIVVGALDRHYNAGAGGKLDLNQQGTEALRSFLVGRNPDSVVDLGSDEVLEHYDAVARSIMALRREDGLLDSWEEFESSAEVTAAALGALRSGAYLGEFSVLAAENVGPQIGSELRVKGILAVVFSLLGMLTYIWFRFELRFGIGALMALVHDVVFTLGLYAFLGYEFNLTTIAAFLTLVGYSVNDSVVVFDRVRENMRRSRREPLIDVLNKSLNQTLARTVLTSGTTLLAVGTLFAFGGDVIRGFSFVLMVGVIVGTYSSIFIASPFVILWESLFGGGARRLRSPRAGAETETGKVPAGGPRR